VAQPIPCVYSFSPIFSLLLYLQAWLPRVPLARPLQARGRYRHYNWGRHRRNATGGGEARTAADAAGGSIADAVDGAMLTTGEAWQASLASDRGRHVEASWAFGWLALHGPRMDPCCHRARLPRGRGPTCQVGAGRGGSCAGGAQQSKGEMAESMGGREEGERKGEKRKI
jgi:hypothetical protein